MNTTQMREYSSNIWKFYLASALGGFAIFYNGVDTLYFRHFQLSFEQVGILASAGLFATLICEIPSGSFADVYGKKKSILVGSFISLIGLFLLAFGSSFAFFTAAFVLLGVGRAFQSGADSALLYDFLSSVHKQDDYIKHQSRMQSAFISIDIISGSLGFLLFAINVRIPFFISVAAMVLVIFVQSTLKEAHVAESSSKLVFKNYLQQIKKGLLITFRSKLIVWLTGFALIYFLASRFFGQVVLLPFFQESKGFTTNQLAIMGFVWNMIQTLLVFMVNHIERILGQMRSFLAIVLLFPATLFALALSNNFILSAIIIGVYFATMSFQEIIVNSYLNAHIDNSYRSTILSVNSMCLSGFTVMILPVLGSLTDSVGLSNILFLLAGSTLLLGCVSLAARRFMS